MKFLHDLGVFAWVFAAQLVALAAIVIAAVSMRARGPWVPLERRLNVTACLVAGGFPVIGFLGTIVGLQKAFGVTSNVAPSDKSTLLAAGIAEAMNCTAAGLALAVPAGAIAITLLVTGAKRAPKKQPAPGSR